MSFMPIYLSSTKTGRFGKQVVPGGGVGPRVPAAGDMRVIPHRWLTQTPEAHLLPPTPNALLNPSRAS